MEVSTVACERCGLVYTSPRMTKEELADFYENEYRALSSGSEAPTDGFLAAARRQASDRAEYLSEHADLGAMHYVLWIANRWFVLLNLPRSRGISVLGA